MIAMHRRWNEILSRGVDRGSVFHPGGRRQCDGHRVARRRAHPAETSVAIEDVLLGQKVQSQNPDASGVAASDHDGDYSGWRIIRLEVHHANSSIVDVQLLRSPEWIARNHLRVGGSYDLRTTEIPVEAGAFVHAIDEGPHIPSGPGAVVTGRFVTRRASDLVRVTFENGEQLTGTRQHPVWSPESMEWRGLGDFSPGDDVQTRHGNLAVSSVEPLSEHPSVYNIEVAGQHVYEVTGAGILVHNNGIDCEEVLKLRKLKAEGTATQKDIDRLTELEKKASEAASNKTPIPWRSVDNATTDSRLVSRAIALRAREGLMNAGGMRRNVAVAKVRVNGKEGFIDRINVGKGGPHSEELIAGELRNFATPDMKSKFLNCLRNVCRAHDLAAAVP